MKIKFEYKIKNFPKAILNFYLIPYLGCYNISFFFTRITFEKILNLKSFCPLRAYNESLACEAELL